MSILRVSNLTKTFRSGFWPFNRHASEYIAVNNISFELQEGEILGLLGANGAGKTTTIQMLLSTMKPTSGSIEYFGKNLTQHRSEILEKVAFASTYIKLPRELSVRDNLEFYARLYGVPAVVRRKRISELLEIFGITQIAHQRTGSLSAGQITRVMLAKAFCSAPKVVLLDEPTASLDPDIAHDVRQWVLRESKEHGTSFIFTSHNMLEVAEVCDRVLVMQRGVIIADDTPENLAQSSSSARLVLTAVNKLAELCALCEKFGASYQVEHSNIIIYTTTMIMPSLLYEIAHEHIHYATISIEEPSLEEYFITLLGRQR